MRNKQTIIIILGIAAAVAMLMPAQAHGQDKQAASEQQAWFEQLKLQFPTALYQVPTDPDTAKRAERMAKNARYDHRGAMVEDPITVFEDGGGTLSDAFQISSAIPTAESELIVVGKILDSNAYLSNNRKDVYSEFTVSVGEVLKYNSANIRKGSTITIDREGGQVLYPNGKKRLYVLAEVRMPLVGKEYVLFLKRPDKSPNYEVVGGYYLGGDHAKSLNSSDLFWPYEKLTRTELMKAIRDKIPNSQDPLTRK